MNDIPLTTEQKEFASEWHNLIYAFLNSKGKSQEDYYDIVVFGFLRAVRRYFTEPELKKYSFSTIAWQAMECDLANYYRSQTRQKRHAYVVSLHSYDGTKALSDKAMEQFATELLLRDLEAIASPSQMEVVHLRSEGYNLREIAKKQKISLKRARELMDESRVLLQEVCHG